MCRKTLWCISFDAVCALAMQIPRYSTLREGSTAHGFSEIALDHGPFWWPVGEGWKFASIKAALIFIQRHKWRASCIGTGAQRIIESLGKLECVLWPGPISSTTDILRIFVSAVRGMFNHLFFPVFRAINFQRMSFADKKPRTKRSIQCR